MECFRIARRSQYLLSTALVVALGGAGQPRVFAQATCLSTSLDRLRVEDLGGAQALHAAVDCTDGGTVEADWAGAVTLDSPISVGSGTFLYITGEDELAEVRGGFQTRMFEVSPSGGLSLTQLKLTGGRAERGGAIRSSMGTVTLDSCTLAGNVAEDGDGGAVLAEGGELMIVGGEFASNSANGTGGAVNMEDDGLLIVQGGTRFGENFAESGGGALYGERNATIMIDGCTFENNVTPGSGGAIAASSATLGGSTLLTDNSAGKDGGAVVGWDPAGRVELNSIVCSNNAAGERGGCFHSSGGVVITNGTVMQDNQADESGGGVYASETSETYVDGGNFTTNRAAGNGGFLYAAGGAVVTIMGGNVSNNVAERRAGAVYCSGAISESGVARVTIAGGTFSGNRALEHAGAIAAWGIHTVVTITGGTFSDNTAKYFGGFIFVEEEASLSCMGAKIEGNSAGDQGGGIYARDATWVISSCDLISNSAPQGAAAYLTYVNNSVFENHTITGSSTSGVSVVFATATPIVAREVIFQSEGRLEEDSSNRAVQLEDEATLVAYDCVFAGWMGDTVIHNENAAVGSLALNACDFSESSSVMVIKSPNSDAGVRNAFVGDLTIENAAMVNNSLVLVDRALTCDDPSACGPGECVDSVLGVLCECLEEGVCLDGGGALSIGLKTAPSAVTYPDLVNFELVVSAAANGTTPVIWMLAFEADELDIQALPSSGVLRPGGNATVKVTGSPLSQDLGGTLVSRFQVTSVGGDNTDPTPLAEIEVKSVFFFCQEFEYAEPEDDFNVTCEQCATVPGAEGLNCEQPGATLASMPVREGFWRSGRDSLVIRPCLHPDACIGATQVSSSDDYCQDGYEGPYCAVCSDGYGSGVDNACHSCKGATSGWLVFAGSIFVLVLLVVIVMALVFLVGGLDAVEGVRQSLSRGTPPDVSARRGSSRFGFGDRLKRWAGRFPQNKVKILVVVWQILTVFPSVSGVSFPPVYSRFLSWIGVVNFDIGSIFSAACIMPAVGFYHRLLITTLAPLGVAAVLVLTYQMAKRRVGIGSASLTAMRAAWSRHMAAGLLLTFLVFTSTSTIAFETFACDDQAVEGESYLRADYRLSCNTTKHKWYMVYSGIMIVVYPVGIPLLYACILWRSRSALNPPARDNADDSTSSAFGLLAMGGYNAKESAEELEERLRQRKQNPDLAPSMFLWKDFGPGMYYYEVIECGRRILLTGVLVFIAPNTAAQAAVACMFAFASLVGFELLRPHLDPMDSWLYRLGCIVIFLSNFLALLIQADAAGEGRRNSLGAVMVAINVVLIFSVLLATCLTTQQALGDHFEGEDDVAVAGTMLTFEQRTEARPRFIPEHTTKPVSSFFGRARSNHDIDSFNRGRGSSACVGPRLHQEARVGYTSELSASGPTVEAVAQISNDTRLGEEGVT